MKIDAVILRETRFVALGTVFFSAIEQLVFMAFRAWDPSVLFGTLLSGGVGVLNFFLLGLTVQRALAAGDGDRAKQMMKLSRTLRMLGMLAVLAVGVVLDFFSTVAVLVSVFFPRLTLIVRQIILQRRGELAQVQPEEARAETEELQDEDENK